MQYARDELTITATLPAGKTGLAMLEFMVEAIATEYGIDPEILRKTLRGERLSPDEVAAFTQAGLHFAPYEDPA